MDRLKTAEHPEGLTNGQEDLSVQLFDIGVIRFGVFRLKLHDTHPEAPFSPIYIDLRLLRRFVDTKKAAIDAYQELTEPLEFDLLADIPTAATPLVSSLSDRIGVGMVTPRADSKRHGTGAKVDGLLEKDKGKRALLIDDLVTRGDSKLEAAKVLINNGLIVKDIAVLIDRDQGGRKLLARSGLRLHSAMTMPQILDFYTRIGKIAISDRSEINQRLQNLEGFLSSFEE